VTSVDVMSLLMNRARSAPRRVVLPEASEETILRAARLAADEGVAAPVLLGKSEVVRCKAEECGVSLDGLELVDTENQAVHDDLVALCRELQPELSPKGIERRLRSPLNAAALLVAAGRVDALVAGLSHSTEDVILASLAFIGPEEGVSVPSSLFLMRVPGFEGPEGELIVFADGGVVIDPGARELADIALTTARSVKALLGWEPRVAMLSYSTKGSSEHESVDKVREAIRLARESDPGLMIDGEFQVDAAIVPEIAARKIEDVGPVAGRANILVFPDLDAGNIAYKCVQRFARADAYGPFLQGFARTVSDLSRGSTVNDVLGVVTLASLHAAGTSKA
jgi:phosphate acetyltransferase